MTRPRQPLTEEQKAIEAEKARLRYHNLTREQKQVRFEKIKQQKQNSSKEAKRKAKAKEIERRLRKTGKYSEEEIAERVELLLQRTELRDSMSKEERKQYKKEMQKKLNRKAREWLAEYKSTQKCAICGESDPSTFDFHHVDPSQKESTINTLINNKNIERVKEEMKKCIILCSNCHRKLHAGRLTL